VSWKEARLFLSVGGGGEKEWRRWRVIFCASSPIEVAIKYISLRAKQFYKAQLGPQKKHISRGGNEFFMTLARIKIQYLEMPLAFLLVLFRW